MNIYSVYIYICYIFLYISTKEVDNMSYVKFILCWGSLINMTYFQLYGGFHSHGGYPHSWMVYTGPTKMDDNYGYPQLWEPSKCYLYVIC